MGPSAEPSLGEAPTAGSRYREFPAPPALADHFLCMWTQSIDGPEPFYAHRVLPDACIDLVLIDDQEPIIVGPWTESFSASFPSGTRIVGARWHPGLAPAMLRVAASELINRSVPLRDLWDAPTTHRLTETASARSSNDRRQLIERLLFERVERADDADLVARAAVHWIARHPGSPVEHLSRTIGISSRQLHRRLAAAIGYGPKTFQSILRFQRLLHLAGRGTGGRRLGYLWAAAGYADQSHMTREVKRFSDTSPGSLLPSADSTLGLSDFFHTTAT